MNAPSEILSQLLVNGLLGSSVSGNLYSQEGDELVSHDDENIVTQETDWPIYISFLPTTPDESIAIYDTAGKMDGRVMRTGEQIEHQGIQVLVRSKDYVEGWQKANEIVLFLDFQIRASVSMETNDVYTIQNVSRSGAFIPLGVEVEGDRRRHLFSINALLTFKKKADVFDLAAQNGSLLVSHQNVTLRTH